MKTLKPKKQIVNAKILKNKLIAKHTYELIFQSHDIAKNISCGQFIHIRITDTTSPLLRRPISIAGVNDSGSCKIIYKVVGKGTQLLSQKKPGEYLDILGPLGHGFPTDIQDKKPVIMGGGVGTAPLLFLAQQIPAGRAFVGFATKDEIFGIETLKTAGFDTKIYTDDGTYGKKGYPTDELEKHIDKDSIIFACGPTPLLKKVKNIAKTKNIPTYISLEERMACGVGACLGCSVKTPDGGYKKTCSDGPVFSADGIIL